MSRARKGGAGDAARAVVWTSVSIVAACALLAPGGLFVPSVTLGAALAWGLLPTMLSRAEPRRSGLYLLIVLVGFLMVLGLASRGGLVLWSVRSLGGGDKLLHWISGFFLALALAWMMGARRAWLGLFGIAAAAVAGGVGEVVQGLVSDRAVEVADWSSHVGGSLVALVPYLLCMAARWCESPDVLPNEPFSMP